MNELSEKVCELLRNQLDSHWKNLYDINEMKPYIGEAIEHVVTSSSKVKFDRLYFVGGGIGFNPLDTIQWMFFLYFLSYELGYNGKTQEATVVYYLNKVMHGMDCYYGVKLPQHVFAEHPVGTILGKAYYGDYFFCYHGVTVGANYRADGSFSYPRLGENVFMFANSTILGSSTIGNNVIVSANTYICDCDVPDNSIVFPGSNGTIEIKQMDERTIKGYTSFAWKWDI